MKFLRVTLLILFSFKESKSEDFKVVGPDAPLVAVAGEDLVLPCFIQPNASAVDLKIQWFRLDLKDTLVHLYKDKKDRNEKQYQSYTGRTSLFKEELQKGNTSLKLSALSVSDEGHYKCFVDAGSWYDDITVHVTIEASGTQPVITMKSYDSSGGINLVCESRGWNPEPRVFWMDKEGDVLPAQDTQIHRDTEGFSVKTQIKVHDHGDSNRFYCRIKEEHHMMETEIIVSSKVFSIWKVAVGTSVSLSLIAVGLIVLMILYFRLKKETEWQKQFGAEQKKILEEELQREKQYAELQRESVEFEYLKKKKKYAVDVTLDPDTAHPELILSDGGKHVKRGDERQNLPDTPKRFDRSGIVLGKQGFSTGRFYYEVQVSGKTMWTAGVVRESINRKVDILACPQDGFWTVCLRNGNEYKARAGPDVPLTLKQKVEKVGVFVDYEEGLVSFYDVEIKSHIYSYTGQSFTEKIYPYLCPCITDGGKNSAPMVILPVNHKI